MRASKRRLGPLLLLLALGACAPGTEDSAVERGDEAFALGRYEEAIAEYRLAVRQGADEPEVLARVAHTYARLGRVDDASTHYASAVAADPAIANQAVTDLMRLAREAHVREDRFAMASAVQAAREIEPALGVRDLALPLARHYFGAGEYGRALP